MVPLGVGHVIPDREVSYLGRVVLGVVAEMVICVERESLATGDLGRHGFLVPTCVARISSVVAFEGDN